MNQPAAASLFLVCALAACGGAGAGGPSDAGPADAGGAEGAAPTLIQPAEGTCKSLHLAVEGQSLFWTDTAGGRVLRSPTTGGTPLTVADGEDAPSALAVRGDVVFWMAGTGGIQGQGASSIRSAASGGGAVATVVAPADGVNGFTVSPDGQTVYFGTSTMVAEVPSTGVGASSTVAHDLRGGVPTGMALDGTRLAYLGTTTGHVQVVTLSAGQEAACTSWDLPVTDNVLCTPIASGNGELFAGTVSLAGDVVVWVDGITVKMASLSMAAPGWTLFTQASGDPITAFTVHDGRVFFADDDVPADDGGNRGMIELAPMPTTAVGSTAVVLAREPGRATSIVADDSSVYWATDDCRILSLPLPR